MELLTGPEIAGPEIIGPSSPVVIDESVPVELQPVSEEPKPDSARIGDDGVELDRVERFRGKDEQWYFHGVATNGEIVYPSQGYADKRGAGRPARSLADRFGVDVVDLDQDPRA